jgi:hypothetical protein
MPKGVTRPLPARLVLLAAAAALAACLVFSLMMAEYRDVDGRASGAGSAISELRIDTAEAAPVEQLRAVPVSATR